MKNSEMKNQNSLSQLEMEIFRASENELTAGEREELEKSLTQHPELEKVYHDLTHLPDISKAYDRNMLSGNRMDRRVDQLLDTIQKLEPPSKSFENLSIHYFKRYALAASLLFLALTSGFYFSQNISAESDITVEELLYPMEESESETYVYYLEQLFEQ
ncbi:hypothetical protein [Rhodohalobacter sp.]|uniref:hypothetical protein n=2 Tax=Rhodohalobacter sp. TaxID=1974210 RepID=UPI003565296F